MKFDKSRSTAIAIATLLTLSMVVSLLPSAFAQVSQPGNVQHTYAFVNVGPNPVGVGQIVTINFFMAAPLRTSEFVQNWTVVQTNPDGSTKTYGPFKSDATGGSYTTTIIEVAGNYTFQSFIAEQVLTGTPAITALASKSDPVTLVVQDEPVQLGYYQITPLPTEWWQTPISANNVQNWYAVDGPWLGYGSVTFAATGGYNNTGNYNPQTESVLAGHILWTKIWASGGANGLSNDEISGHVWSTSQYWPKYAPVIINGIMYSDWKAESNSLTNGILATDIYTGQTLFRINTTNALRCGMVTAWKTVNMYGSIGPYIWTTGTLPAADTGGTVPANRGTQWNMYSALTGQYVLSIVNGTNPTLTTDENGDIIGYYINTTRSTDTMTTYGWPAPFANPPVTGVVDFTSELPVLVCWNMSQALANTWGWGPGQNSVYPFDWGVTWVKPLPSETDAGVQINQGGLNNPTMSINGITNGAVVMTAGFSFGQGFGGQQVGWLLVGAQDANTGAVLWAHNFTSADTDTLLPDSRTQMAIQNGVWMNVDMANFNVFAVDARTGKKAWTAELRDPDGTSPHGYDVFNLKNYNGPDARVFFEGFGGDIWCLNSTTGELLWQTTTNDLIGNPGLETPYGTWPLWVFTCSCVDNNIAYFAIGHEYNPPLFHGAQLLALNVTDGSLVWSVLDMSIESTSISYGILLSRNAYDNQIYAFGKGPSTTTIAAPAVGVTTDTPIVLSGTVMDVSPGTRYLEQPDQTKTKQNEVALRFPNGVPCVSDESESHWMEYVYEQQPAPSDATGVTVTLSVIDSNNNYRDIGTATTDTSGTYSMTWTPDITGDYTVIATFASTNSYYGSCAETHITATEPPTTPTPPTSNQPDNTGTYVTYAAIAIIVAIVIVGIATVLVLRKR